MPKMNTRVIIEPTFWFKIAEWVLGIVQFSLSIAYPSWPTTCFDHYNNNDIPLLLRSDCTIPLAFIRLGAIMLPIIILPALISANLYHRGFARNIVNLLFALSGVFVYLGAASSVIADTYINDVTDTYINDVTDTNSRTALIMIATLSCVTATVCFADFITDIVLKFKRGRH